MCISVSRGCILRILALVLGFNLTQARITLNEKGGYENVIVSIGEDVAENELILSRIQDLFEDGSAALHRATNGLVHFASVTVVVPHNWLHFTKWNYAVVNKDDPSVQTRHIRIDTPNPVYGNTPYTLQPGGCGEQGEYMHLTPDYILNMFSNYSRTYGPPGKVLVHEWAHLRWGVFDEYPNPKDFTEPFYVAEDQQVHVTGCTDEVSGWLRTENGEECHADATGRPDYDCHFYADDKNSVKGSLMNLYYLESVDKFCDNSSVPHNSIAPNTHNLQCEGRSVWEVMSRHSDFERDKNRYSRSGDYVNLPPPPPLLFLFLQESGEPLPNFILLLDISSSMDAYMDKMHQLLVRFVRDLVPAGSMMGVVSFDYTTYFNFNYTKITEANREDAANSLPKNHTCGNTSPGAGLRDVTKYLMQNNVKEGVTIVLVTDGEESSRPLVKDIMPKVIEAKVIINPISFGPYATDSLEDWAAETEGHSFYYSLGTGNLDAILYNAITVDKPQENKILQVHRKYHTSYTSEKFVIEEVNFDSSIGDQVRFTFTETCDKNDGGLSTEVELEDPNGVTHSKNSLENDHDVIIKLDEAIRTYTFVINNVKPGRWRYILHNKKPWPKKMSVVVTAKPAKKEKKVEHPIRVDTWSSISNVTFPAKIKIYAKVSAGYSPVLNASVTAHIEPPKGTSTILLPLSDNGIGADLGADDGIYSAFFTQITGDGRYGLTATVNTNNHASIVKGYSTRNGNSLSLQGGPTSAVQRRQLPVDLSTLPKPEPFFHPKNLLSPRLLDDPAVAPNRQRSARMVKIHAEPTTRFSSGGAFKVNNFRPGDYQPPGRVMDLEVERENVYDASIGLTWTSTGDDLDYGTAKSLELRYINFAPERFVENFEKNGTRVTDQHLQEGNLIPRKAGERHRLRFKLNISESNELEGRVYFVAIRAEDEAGNIGDISNMARAYFPYPTKEYRQKTKKELTRLNQLSGLVVLVVLVVVILIIVIFVMTVKMMHIKRQKKMEDDIPITSTLNRSGGSSSKRSSVCTFNRSSVYTVNRSSVYNNNRNSNNDISSKRFSNIY